MCQHTIAARSKLKNFAPKILLCAGLIVLSIRNANIVFGGTAEELGILSFELEESLHAEEANLGGYGVSP